MKVEQKINILATESDKTKEELTPEEIERVVDIINQYRITAGKLELKASTPESDETRKKLTPKEIRAVESLTKEFKKELEDIRIEQAELDEVKRKGGRNIKTFFAHTWKEGTNEQRIPELERDISILEQILNKQEKN